MDLPHLNAKHCDSVFMGLLVKHGILIEMRKTVYHDLADSHPQWSHLINLQSAASGLLIPIIKYPYNISSFIGDSSLISLTRNMNSEREYFTDICTRYESKVSKGRKFGSISETLQEWLEDYFDEEVLPAYDRLVEFLENIGMTRQQMYGSSTPAAMRKFLHATLNADV